MFEAAIIGPAREVWNQLNERDRQEVWRLITLIELAPHIDGVHKIMIDVEVIQFTVYNNLQFGQGEAPARGNWR